MTFQWITGLLLLMSPRLLTTAMMMMTFFKTGMTRMVGAATGTLTLMIPVMRIATEGRESGVFSEGGFS
uniref:Uncharacterized protein n=1 Tax=Arundo donax TaxID=35708 RepID=A0A0A9EX69_ARUDO